jgi:hypothetical protein
MFEEVSPGVGAESMCPCAAPRICFIALELNRSGVEGVRSMWCKWELAFEFSKDGVGWPYLNDRASTRSNVCWSRSGEDERLLPGELPFFGDMCW